LTATLIPITDTRDVVVTENVPIGSVLESPEAKSSKLSFDFVIPTLRLAIEVQGEQHYKHVFNRSDKQKANDRMKRRLCHKENLRLIEVRHHV